MTDVVPFTPRPALGAAGNLRKFIAHWKKNLDGYLPGLEWSAVTWNVAPRHRLRGRHERVKRVTFTPLGSTASSKVPMHEEFIDFAKAYIPQQLTLSGEKTFSGQLGALRVLEAALKESSADGVPRVIDTNELVADRGAEIITSTFGTTGSRYNMGGRFKALLEFLVKTGLVVSPFGWKNPFPPPDLGATVGAEYEKRRSARLPSRDVLAGLGIIFDKATEERDVITSSCLALLCSAPERICETVTLPNHCEVWLKNGDGTKDLALRWEPAKRGSKGLKPICSEMAPVAAKAIERVRALTEEARKIALWYEKNRTRLYLPKELEHLRQKELITCRELALVLGSIEVRGWMAGVAKHYGLTIYKRTVWLPNRWRKDGTRSQFRKEINMYSFAELERKILRQLPETFPWMDEERGVKFSEALFVVKRGLFNPTIGTMPCMFAPVTLSAIVQQLGSHPSAESIFDRFGLKNQDGSRMKMTSNQARHWLNSLAERGGLSDLERDMWSGRRTGVVRDGEAAPTGRQSLSYLHNTVEELMESAGLKPEDMDRSDSLAKAVERLPVTPEEFQALDNKPTVHVTEYGICFHDFSMAPCQVHADCLNCMEHACYKGDPEKYGRIRQCRAIVQEQIEMARQMVEEGYLKAEPWYQHQVLTERRLAALLKIFEDPTVLPGEPILLVNPFQYSPFRNAVLERAGTVGDNQSITLAKTIGMPHLPHEILEWRTGGQS